MSDSERDQSNACRRMRDVMSDLCGFETDDENTFYIYADMSQGREVRPSDVDEVARAAEDAKRSLELNLALDADESVSVQSIPREASDSLITTIFKLPTDRIPASTMPFLLQSVEENMGEGDVVIGRGLDRVEFVDREIVAQIIPEMVGPPREDAEVFE